MVILPRCWHGVPTEFSDMTFQNNVCSWRGLGPDGVPQICYRRFGHNETDAPEHLGIIVLSRFIMLFLMFFLMVGPWKLETSQLRIDIMKPGHSSLWVERRRNLRCLRYTQPVLYKQINKHLRTEAVPLVRSQSSKALFAQFAQTLVLSDGTAKFLMTNHCCSWRICGCKERAWEDTT